MKIKINDEILDACAAAEAETKCRRCGKIAPLNIDERFIPLCFECYKDPATHNARGGCSTISQRQLRAQEIADEHIIPAINEYDYRDADTVFMALLYTFVHYVRALPVEQQDAILQYGAETLTDCPSLDELPADFKIMVPNREEKL